MSGDEVETVVGMLLCSRYPNAVRVRPSQGDGGIDIFIPGPAGWGKERAVWQIKRYSTNLTSTPKRAIKSSFVRVVETSNREGWRITEWHLIMPLDLTSQNLGWMDSFIENAGFPCDTHGLLLCDTLAGDYPNVIDYYLRDGKDRLQAGLESLTRILSGRQNRRENEPLMPADVMIDVASIHKALNACDPFYRYNFDASDRPPPDDPSPSDEGLVAAYAVCQDSVWITIKIYARSLAALEERPITWRLQLAVPADDLELRKQVEKFIDYGAPLTMPIGTVTGSLDLPAGIGGDLGRASLQVTNLVERPVDDEETELAIAMLAPDSDTVIAGTTIKRTEFSQGQSGARSIWVDQANLFTIEMLANRSTPRKLTWNFTIEYDLNGRRPADIVDSLGFLAAKHAPNRIGIGLTYGPREFASGGTAPDPEYDKEAKRWSTVAQALAQIQDHVSALIRMPAEMSMDQAIEVVSAAKLLSGETVSCTMSGSPYVVYHPPQTQIDREMGKLYEFATIRPIAFTLGEDEITAGKEVLFFRGQYLEVGDEQSTIQPVPNSDAVIMRYTGDLEVTRVLTRHLQGIANIDDSLSPEAEAGQDT
nr:restriction endonuclease [Mycobacterium marinum]